MGNTARILVVDDDQGIRNSLVAILKDEGYRVDAVMSGSEAIERAETTVYNVALIDIRLPDMQGTEILRRMKATVPKTRKIILTGYPSMQNAIEALNMGADAYVLKTVTAEKLLATIREQLKLQETERKYSEQKVAEFIKTRVNETIDTVREKLQEIESDDY